MVEVGFREEVNWPENPGGIQLSKKQWYTSVMILEWMKDQRIMLGVGFQWMDRSIHMALTGMALVEEDGF